MATDGDRQAGTAGGGYHRNLHAIAAMCEDGGIGFEGRLLVGNKGDMRRFAQLTTGHVAVMGRRTLESLPGGRPLKGRRNIVLTSSGEPIDGAETASSVEEVLSLCGGEEAWVIGGASVYEAMLPLCSSVELTVNHAAPQADAFFPDVDAAPEWVLVSRVSTGADGEPLRTEDGVEYEFRHYRRAEEMLPDAGERGQEPGAEPEPGRGQGDGQG